jgi:hypothetical protein
MKNIKFIYLKIICLQALLFTALVSCERDLSDEVVFATFSKVGEIFTDSPIGMGSDFYFPYQGSKPTAWSVDDEVSYKGTSSMRFDVPNANDPEGNYAGAIFRVDGAGRDLTEFDALTFWAKASQGVTIGQFGFGTDFLEDKFVAVIPDVDLSTSWTKYIIPIPDPSKLFEERGMFSYSTGTRNTNGYGYTFWIDELQFEKLGTVGQPLPIIMLGEDVTMNSFIGTTIDDLQRSACIFNLPSGEDQLVATYPSYFSFESTNPSVASVSEDGLVTVLNSGTAVITASLAGVQAVGSLTIESSGSFEAAPEPPSRDAANVISIFSDAYDNVPVDYYNGFFAPFQTTQGGAPPLDFNGDMIINYTELNFVGIGTFFDVLPVNITSMTHLHIDIKVNEPIDGGDYINIQLINDVGGNETSGTIPFGASTFVQDQWVGLDIPIADFGMGDLTRIGLLFFISDATISNIFVDNIYYYR